MNICFFEQKDYNYIIRLLIFNKKYGKNKKRK